MVTLTIIVLMPGERLRVEESLPEVGAKVTPFTFCPFKETDTPCPFVTFVVLAVRENEAIETVEFRLTGEVIARVGGVQFWYIMVVVSVTEPQGLVAVIDMVFNPEARFKPADNRPVVAAKLSPLTD